jgi:hypothetical protein
LEKAVTHAGKDRVLSITKPCVSAATHACRSKSREHLGGEALELRKLIAADEPDAQIADA